MAFLEADGRSGLHPDRGGTRRRLHKLASEEPKLQPLLDTAQPRQPESIHPRPLQVCVAAIPDPLCQKTISQGGRAADRVRTNDSWFNPCAFTSPAGSFGNFGRNVLRSSSVYNMDLSLFRKIRFGEKKELQLAKGEASMSFKSRCLLVSVVLSVVLLLGGEALSQTITGTITGTVTDASGGVIPGATVTLVSEQTGESRNVTANGEGRFSFAAVQPGTYTVRMEQKGFQTLERKGTVLSANESLALGDIPLQTGQVSETVVVTSDDQLAETESSDLTARITSDQIALISTKGRDITSLLRLIPGTSNDDDVEAVGEGFGTNLPNISGARGRSAVATIDGLNAAEPSGNNKISMTINQDAVGEVKVLRNNYAAEYGNNGGALINIVSKGGGKEYRGSAYYFLRNEALNASPFFSNKAGLKKPLYRHNIWGFNEGGPLPLPRFGEGGPRLLRNKAFFFFSLKKPHTITTTDPVFVTMPTALERLGDFSQSFDSTGAKVFIRDPNIAAGNCSATDQSACFRDPSRASSSNPTGLNIIPLSRINKSGQALLNFFPLPNSVGGRTLAGAAFNFVNQKSVDVPKHSYVIRFDLKPTNKDSVYWKGQWWTSDNLGLGTSGWPSGDANRWGIFSH